jgi:hypothetical protein
MRLVVLPMTTMQLAYHNGDKFDFFVFTTARGYKTKDLQEKVKTLLRERHDIAPTDEGAFMCFDFEQLFTMFDYLFLGIKILIWIVGIGTLLSGVVGVSNIIWSLSRNVRVRLVSDVRLARNRL